MRTGAVGGRRIVEVEIGAPAQEEAVDAAVVIVSPDDLAHVVDAECTGAKGGQRIVKGGEADAAQQETVGGAGGVRVFPDDLTCVVDAVQRGVIGG
jgi:hypothetical protein